MGAEVLKVERGKTVAARGKLTVTMVSDWMGWAFGGGRGYNYGIRQWEQRSIQSQKTAPSDRFPSSCSACRYGLVTMSYPDSYSSNKLR